MATIFKRKGQKKYTARFFDHTGRRVDKSTRTTDKRTAQRIADKWEADVALRREGVIDATAEALALQAQTSICSRATLPTKVNRRGALGRF